MRIAVLWLLAAGAAQAYCPEPSVQHHLTCVQTAKSIPQQRQCAAEIELDLEQWDEWEACKLKDLAQKHQAEREAISERASSRRRALFSGLPLLLR